MSPFFFSFEKSLLNLLQYCFCLMFWFFGHEACEILAPWPEIKLASPTLKEEVPTTGQPEKSLGEVIMALEISSSR